MAARGATVWLTGLPAAGKTTVGDALAAALAESGYACYRLDGDQLRSTLNADLGFDAVARNENVRRVSQVARILADAGLIAIVSLISPYKAARRAARKLHDAAGLPFLEVYLDTPLSECERRDPDGLYARAHRGEITGVTGIDDPYEPPDAPELTLHPGRESVREAVDRVLETLSRSDLSRVLTVAESPSESPR